MLLATIVAQKDRWSKGRAPRDYLPLTDDVFAAHLAGGDTVGIYPLLRGDACALLVCDFDRGSWALDALAYLDACHANGVPAALEHPRPCHRAERLARDRDPMPPMQHRLVRGRERLRRAGENRSREHNECDEGSKFHS